MSLKDTLINDNMSKKILYSYSKEQLIDLIMNIIFFTRVSSKTYEAIVGGKLEGYHSLSFEKQLQLISSSIGSIKLGVIIDNIVRNPSITKEELEGMFKDSIDSSYGTRVYRDLKESDQYIGWRFL